MRVIGRFMLSLGMGALLGVAAMVPAPAAPPPAVALGNQWDVTPVAGGYQLTLRLDAPAPMRASLPLLAVDGVPIGVARQSPDRRTLRLVTTDPAVLKAKDVRLVWSGDVGKGNGQRGFQAGGQTDADWLKARRGPLLKDDPGALGKYQVETAEYNLGDETVYLPGLKQRSELRGKVYTPSGAVGPRPLVIFLHGRHEYCYGNDSAPSEKPWPCSGGTKPVPSFRGYDAPAKALASNGYEVVSISANAVNAYDGDVYDSGAQARAELILDHLALWKRWSTIGGGPFGDKFVGKIDLRNVGLMGHSRGGEGVARAAVLNADRGGQYGIRAVLPLAPTDFARATVPGVAMSVVLPYCDGDVSDLQGQKFYDDTRYSVTGDPAPRSTVTVLGANHNFFNTEWTPGQSEAPSFDDWFGEGKESPCGPKYAGRLTAKEQQAVGTAYIAGFFRLQLGHERKFLPLLDGSDSRAASAGKAVVRVVSQAPAATRRDVNHLDQALPAGPLTGKASATVCAGVSQSGLAAAGTCMATDDWSNAPHWVPSWYAARTPTTPVTKLSWTGTNGVLRLNLPAWQRDVRRYAALSFRAAPDAAGAPRTDLSVRVVDGHGRPAVVPVCAVSDALVRMPGRAESGLPKNLLRTVRIPVSSLKGVDLRDVRAVELRTDRVARGSAYVSDLAFSSPGLGFSAPAALLPRLSASNVTVKEGDSGTKNMDFWVTLSRPSIRQVKVYVETNGELGETVGDVTRQLLFKPGQVRQKVSVPVAGNKRDSYDLPFSLVLSAPREALLDRPFGHGLVVDDDPTPTLTIGDARTVEKAGVLRFPVKLSAPSDRYVTFSGVLKDGTAVIRKDYTSAYDDGTNPPDRTADGYVEPGKTTGDLSALIVDDKLKEPTETFTIQLTSVDGATLKLPKTVTATITDND
ncbi:Calx-beta domain-containing protein [Kribbella antiqua]|uniref:Calx-beta domain-containing protein n=1 Tax=Kribbella antiqua TaxID=2512217 RepID=A0A4R2IN79_9ACTN|nr:Calx-beta domain-containing protein [Kribbella antiqua]TCO45459.1 Calx-beta domain-containing protein [Kribbella antiqua]